MKELTKLERNAVLRYGKDNPRNYRDFMKSLSLEELRQFAREHEVEFKEYKDARIERMRLVVSLSPLFGAEKYKFTMENSYGRRIVRVMSATKEEIEEYGKDQKCTLVAIEKG